jgi:hypothetical protein
LAKIVSGSPFGPWARTAKMKNLTQFKRQTLQIKKKLNETNREQQLSKKSASNSLGATPYTGRVLMRKRRKML